MLDSDADGQYPPKSNPDAVLRQFVSSHYAVSHLMCTHNLQRGMMWYPHKRAYAFRLDLELHGYKCSEMVRLLGISSIQHLTAVAKQMLVLSKIAMQSVQV